MVEIHRLDARLESHRTEIETPLGISFALEKKGRRVPPALHLLNCAR
jgi:hypothetical protein